MNRLLIDLPETLETKNLWLKMPRSGFGQSLHQAIMDGYEDCVMWLNWPDNPPSVEQVEIDCRQHHADFILRSSIRYLIVDKVDGSVVGRCAFPSHQANWSISQFGISYFVRKTARSRGFATEAAGALSQIAFDVLKARKVEIFCDAQNTASIKIPLKLGFELEYVQKGGWLTQCGTLAELRTYSIFSQENLKKTGVILHR